MALSRSPGAGWFPVQWVGKLDLNFLEHVRNGCVDCQVYLSAPVFGRGVGGPASTQAMLSRCDGSSQQTSQETLGQLGQYL